MDKKQTGMPWAIDFKLERPIGLHRIGKPRCCLWSQDLSDYIRHLATPERAYFSAKKARRSSIGVGNRTVRGNTDEPIPRLIKDLRDKRNAPWRIVGSRC